MLQTETRWDPLYNIYIYIYTSIQINKLRLLELSEETWWIVVAFLSQNRPRPLREPPHGPWCLTLVKHAWSDLVHLFHPLYFGEVASEGCPWDYIPDHTRFTEGFGECEIPSCSKRAQMCCSKFHLSTQTFTSKAMWPSLKWVAGRKDQRGHFCWVFDWCSLWKCLTFYSNLASAFCKKRTTCQCMSSNISLISGIHNEW